MTDLDHSQADQQQQTRRPPRSSSPAKRPHSDMDEGSVGDGVAASNARHNSSQPSPRATKSLPVAPAASQHSARATSVEMADIPNSTSSETDASNAESSATSIDVPHQVDLPSLDEQVARVMIMMSSELKEGQEGYVISEKWLERVWARTSENINRPQDFSKDATQGPIGPVDNSGLVDLYALQDDLADHHGDDFIPLNKGVQMGQDFEILPARAWELVVGWYGLKEGSPVIRRYAHNTVPDKSSENIIYELFPPILTIRKLQKLPLTAAENTRPAVRVVASTHESLSSFLEAAKKASGINLDNKVRIWRILKGPTPAHSQTPLTSGILTPDASPRERSPAPSSRPLLFMHAASFAGLVAGTERELVTGGNDKASLDYHETLTLADAGLAEDQVIVLEEHDERGQYTSDISRPGSKGKQGLQISSDGGRNSPSLVVHTRGRTRNGKVRGHVGLTNLGNTCYMNSALQCLRSVEELSMYFLNKKWQDEVNASNPIGHKGAIAKVYAQLLTQIYDVGNVSSFAPKNFKQTLGKENNLFSGYGQQDSQEFVSWLVDALHEDLNRVHEKPYRENPDSDDNTFRDLKAIRTLGETYRENHRARNDSVATDLFSGFYKNTMVCPVCNKVSITFDPYSQLTLQLPIEQSWVHTVTYVPLYSRPFQLEVDIDKNATIKALKEYVGKRGGGVPANRLMASEVYSHKFYRHLDDNATISESNISVRDDIYFYELEHVPSNWPVTKKKVSRHKPSLPHDSSDEEVSDSASPLHDKILIPVFHRGPNLSSYRTQTFSLSLWPFHIVLTREEAKDFDAILRKILAKVAQATTRPFLNELSTTSSDRSHSSSDVVLTTEEDSSPDDPQVNDGSIEGEDMVEVTMTDSNKPSKRTEQEGIPEALQPGSFIHPELRQLFELKHIRKSNEIVTTGWSTVDHSRVLEPISKRIRMPSSKEESGQSSPIRSDDSSCEEDACSQITDTGAAMAAVNVSSDEGMETTQLEISSHIRNGRANNKKSRKQRREEQRQERKYRSNKTFRRNRTFEQSNYPDDIGSQDDESLIKTGEALVLEWNSDAYDALFGGNSEDDPCGQDAMKFTETLNDPEIQEKKARRAARRKHGISLEECFIESSKSEVLSEDNAWYCNRCKELRRATKTLDIWTVPDILIIHLKRFSGHRSFRDKIEELVDFPVEGLDLLGKVGFPEGRDLTYDLFAVDNHYGGLGGGHYTATAQNFFDKQWYEYNDSVVTRCQSSQKVVTRAAYLLFYRRRSPRPLGPVSLQQIVAMDTGPDSESDIDIDGPRSNSPAGNGLGLGDLSRNGSSSVGGVVAGVGALRGGGSPLLAAESRLKNVIGTESLHEDDVDMPPIYDEGFVEAESEYVSEMYGPLNRFSNDAPRWSFENLSQGRGLGQEFDDAASDAPNPGSTGTEEVEDRLAKDFGDEDLGNRSSVSVSAEGIQVTLDPSEEGDGDVAEIRLKNP